MSWINVKLGEMLDYEQPTNYIVASDQYDDAFETPVLTAGKSFILGYTNEVNGIYSNLPVIIFDDFTTESKYVDFPFKVKSSAMKILNVNKDTADIRFMYYLLQTVNINSTQHKRYWISKYANLDVKVPPLPTQQRIAEILDKADALRKKDRQLLQHYDDLAQSLFIDMFGDPIRNEKGWEVKSLGELILDGPQNGLYKSSTSYGSGTPILRIDSFYNGVVSDITLLKRVNASTKEIELFQIYEGNIVINRVNSKSHLGKCALIPKLNEPTLFESNMMRFKVNQNLVDPLFITKMLIQPFMKKQILGRAKDSINQSSINQQDVKSFTLPVPPIALQNQFAAQIQNIEQQKEKVKAQLQESEHLFQALLQKAFSGGLN